MATEIERKFLVTDDRWRAAAGAGKAYRQGYLCRDGRVSLRVRIAGTEAKLAIKARKEAQAGAISRYEYEYAIGAGEAEEMLRDLVTGGVIAKTRYEVEHAGLVWEIDVFEEDNAPLILAEVELDSPDQALTLPAWAGREVSEDGRYFNAYLAEHPYSSWD
jgi:adenylate cyclase